jgi:hypothetical protein
MSGPALPAKAINQRSNAMTMTMTTTVPADGFAVAEKRGNLIRGKLVKFSGERNVYLADKVVELPAATEYVAVDVVTAWIKWGVDGKPEHRITEPGQRHPDRDELGNQDQDQWPIGIGGKPADPWRDTRYLFLINPMTGDELTFVTESYGGRRGVGDLKTSIMNVRSAKPGALPVVKLASVPWPTQWGTRLRPHFEIVGWKGSAVEQQPPPVKRIAAPPTASLSDLDDEIPF